MSSNNIKILTIDDEDFVRETMAIYFEDCGFQVVEAPDGKAGIDKFKQEKPDIVFIDLRMPGISGMEVISELSTLSPNTPLITVSGTGIVQDAINSIRKGAWDFISKPIQDMAVLEYTVKKSLERSRLIKENEEYKIALEKKVSERTKELEKSNEQLKTTMKDLVDSLSIITDKRDPYTFGHQIRVAKIALAIAENMGFTSEQIEAIRIAAQLHDIGKIYVPAEFLAKPTKLDPEEMAIIRKHSSIGYEILKNIKFPWPIADIVHQHHERLDGSGYPKGLKEDQILLEAKIIAIADVVEAMSSHRPYRPALGLKAALSEIEKKMGIIYCKECSKVLIEICNDNCNIIDDL